MQPQTQTLKANNTAEAGFTLIELSIVLVIIGLIVSGVLVGQGLIKAAEIRATMTQLSKFDTAANGFRDRYNGIPGDYQLPLSILAGVTGSDATTRGTGDGNGLIESAGTAHAYGTAGEPAAFFAELSKLQLIDGTYTVATMDATAITISSTILPTIKAAKGGFFSVGSAGGANYYLLGKYSGATDGTTGAATNAGVLNASQAQSIDAKIDDGIPNSGLVFSTVQTTGDPSAAGGGHATAGIAATDCFDSTLGVYNAAAVNTQACTVAVRASF